MKEHPVGFYDFDPTTDLYMPSLLKGDFLENGNFLVQSPVGFYSGREDVILGMRRWERRLSALAHLIEIPDWIAVSFAEPKITCATTPFEFDFNSVFFRLAWFFYSRYETKRPPLPHDICYRINNYLRREGVITGREHAKWRKLHDTLFLECLLHEKPKIAKRRAYYAYFGVRTFGSLTWKGTEVPGLNQATKFSPFTKKPK